MINNTKRSRLSNHSRIYRIISLLLFIIVFWNSKVFAYFLVDVESDPKYIKANGTSTSTITATVTIGQTGEPKAGALVIFMVGDYGSVDPVVETTDEYGKAQTTFTSDTTPAWAPITAQVTASMPGWEYSLTYIRTIYVCMVKIGLQVSDLFGSVEEAAEENPGAYIHRNIDNDNANTDGNGSPINDETEDTLSVENENDLNSISIDLQPADIYEGTVKIWRTNTKARAWSDSGKGAANAVVTNSTYKMWRLYDETERSDFNDKKTHLFVEGYLDVGNTLLTAEFRPPEGAVLDYDRIKCNFIATTCGWQPKPLQRIKMEQDFENLIHCEWSIREEDNSNYNCIAWSVGETDAVYWMNPVDSPRGDGDSVIEVSDFDALYDYYNFTTTSDINEATIILYKNTGKASPSNPDGITHAARKLQGCSCGAGKWIMFESKLGPTERIEHRRDQLNGTNYGEPFRYYKPKP